MASLDGSEAAAAAALGDLTLPGGTLAAVAEPAPFGEGDGRDKAASAAARARALSVNGGSAPGASGGMRRPD